MELLRSHQTSYATDWKTTSSPVRGRWHGMVALGCAMGLVLTLALLGWSGPTSTHGSLSRLSVHVMAPKVAHFQAPHARIVKRMGGLSYGHLPSHGPLSLRSTASAPNKATSSNLKPEFTYGLGQHLATHPELHGSHPSTPAPVLRSEMRKSSFIRPDPKEASKVASAVPFQWLGVCLLSVLVTGGLWLAKRCPNPTLPSDVQCGPKHGYKAHTTVAMLAMKTQGDEDRIWGGLLRLVSQKPKHPIIPGQGPIPRPDKHENNHTATQIMSSPLDLSKLIAGGDMDTPQQASKLRPDQEWIEFQKQKIFKDQSPIVDVLEPLDTNAAMDVLVVGAGPAGLAVAAEMAQRGVSVGLIAPDTPFVNNYGVWLDEFQELGLTNCLLYKYDDALVWFNDQDPAEGIGLGRGYGQVCRRRLREELLGRCKAAGVKYAPGVVDTLRHRDASKGEMSVVNGTINREGAEVADEAFEMSAKVVVCGTGHNRDMLQYDNGPRPGWQTAYGIEVKMPGHPFAPNKAVFMDFRQSDPELELESEESERGVWRVPSFLYVLPVDEDTVFVEETCLVARVQVPFDELKRRLYRRLSRMGLNVTQDQIIEEEASWIPLGGTPPTSPQRTLAYGAAAGLVHPASGYSIVNSLRRAPQFAEAVVDGLKAGGSVEAANRGWDVLWGGEPRRQVGFYQFGMELLMSLRIEQMRNFFSTFFGLPKQLSAGFLGNNLTSVQLLQFALTVFFQGNWELRALLLSHIASAGAGVRLGKAYAYPLFKRLWINNSDSTVDIVDRQSPPQEPNFSSFAQDLFSAEEQGFLPGFQGKDWWGVGTKREYGEKEYGEERLEDDDDLSGSTLGAF